jgi:hypothetical protein
MLFSSSPSTSSSSPSFILILRFCSHAHMFSAHVVFSARLCIQMLHVRQVRC